MHIQTNGKYFSPSQNSLLLPFLVITKFHVIDGTIPIMYGMCASARQYKMSFSVKLHDKDKDLPYMHESNTHKPQLKSEKSPGVGVRSKDYDFVKPVE